MVRRLQWAISMILGGLTLRCAPVRPYSTTSTSAQDSTSSAPQQEPTAAQALAVSPPRALAPAAASAEPSPSPPLAEASSEKIEILAGLSEIHYGDLVEALRSEANRLGQEETIRREHRELMSKFSLDEEELPLESFSRVRLLFEATRDGGLWGLRWDITDQMPWSDRIWEQWEALEWHGAPEDRERYTAIAECDELSALFAFLARDVGVEGFVGLHWPTWNHVVAVWELRRKSGEKVRILVPTSQVFLTPAAGLGTLELKTNRVVFPYSRQDLKLSTRLSPDLTRYLIRQLRLFGGLSQSELQERRNHRGGS